MMDFASLKRHVVPIVLGVSLLFNFLIGSLIRPSDSFESFKRADTRVGSSIEVPLEGNAASDSASLSTLTPTPSPTPTPTPTPIPNSKESSSPVRDKNSILPKRIFSVIGLESSGTRFVTKTITEALGAEEFREGSAHYATKKNDRNEIQVQHFSLPWGSNCLQHPEIKIQRVVLPPQCSRDFTTNSNVGRQCVEMARDTNNTVGRFTIRLAKMAKNWNNGGLLARQQQQQQHRGNQTVVYPQRYLPDIVSSIEWYESRGVDQTFIIVVRDEKISQGARRGHCSHPKRLEREERVGTEIIDRAIRKYILEETLPSFESWRDQLLVDDDDNGGGGKTTNQTTQSTDASDRDDKSSVRSRKLVASLSSSSSSAPSFLHGNNNVVLVSYESLIKLGDVYVKLLYKALGIESIFAPKIVDGNAKYTAGAMFQPWQYPGKKVKKALYLPPHLKKAARRKTQSVTQESSARQSLDNAKDSVEEKEANDWMETTHSRTIQ